MAGGAKAYLPLQIFEKGGAVVATDEWAAKMFRDEDKEHGFAIARDGFKVRRSWNVGSRNVAMTARCHTGKRGD